jgi:hypothetical protein
MVLNDDGRDLFSGRPVLGSRRSTAWTIARTEPCSSSQHDRKSRVYTLIASLQRLHRASPGLQIEIGDSN